MPELSIVVTSYNVEKYLEGSLRSVLDQTLADIEIIVVDDGSTDASPDIIKRLAKSDARLIPVLLPNRSPGGVATAANAGLDRATGAYVGFVDGDDLCESVMFERLLVAAQMYDSDLAMCNYKLLDDETGNLSDPADRRRWLDLNSDHYELDVESRKQVLHFVAVPWRKIYRRQMLESTEIRFPVSEHFYEDNPFHWFCTLSARSIAFVPQQLCYHRMGRSGQTMAADPRLLGIFSHHDTIRTWLRDHGLEPAYQSSLVGWVISQTEWISAKTPIDLRRELFDTVRPLIAGYDDITLNEALDETAKGRVTRQLVHALRVGSLAKFHLVLDKRDAKSSLFEKVVYQLRFDGLWQTARVGFRFVFSRARRDSASIDPLSGPQQPPALIRNKDLMFTLLLIDRRLCEVDARIRRLEDERGRTNCSDED